jgi:hypothetical protein
VRRSTAAFYSFVYAYCSTWLVFSCFPAITSKVANVPAPITDVCAKIAAINADFSGVRPNLLTIGSEFFLRCPFVPVLTKLAHVTSALAYVSANIPAVDADFPSIGPHFSAIGTQLSALTPIDAS